MTSAIPRPVKMSEIVGNPSVVAFAREWAQGWQNGKKAKPLLICGPTGSGKTSLACAMAAEFGFELFEFNASDLRNEEAVSSLLANAAASGTLFGGMRLILIDDADSLSGAGDRGGSGAIAKALQSAQQPIILTAANPYDRKLSGIKSHCTVFEFRRISSSTIAALLGRAAAAAKVSVPRERIEKIAQSSSGDARAALCDLFAGSSGAFRDSEKSVFETVRAILKSEKYLEARAAVFSSGADHDTLKLWISHNLPIEYDRPFDLAEAYGHLSRADVFDGRIKRTQHWGYLRYSGDLMSSGVAVAKTAPYRKFAAYGFPEYLRAMGASKSSRAMRLGVLRKISQRCHCSIQQSALYLPLLKGGAKDSQQEIADFFAFDADEIGFVLGAAGKAGQKARA